MNIWYQRVAPGLWAMNTLTSSLSYSGFDHFINTFMDYLFTFFVYIFASNIFLISGGEGQFAPNVPLLVLEVLQAAALKDDIVLVLHQDRKDHRIMSYINRIESLTLAEQEEIAKLLCNLCGQPSTFDWLLYISEWTENDGSASSNSRVTTRAAVHTVLNDKLTTLQKTGVALIFNLALKELF